MTTLNFLMTVALVSAIGVTLNAPELAMAKKTEPAHSPTGATIAVENTKPTTSYASAPSPSHAGTLEKAKPAPSPGGAVKSRDQIIWTKCAQNMTPHCGYEIVRTMLGVKGSSVSIKCCEIVVKMGLRCHVLMKRLLIKDLSPKYAKFLKHNFGTYKNCAEQIYLSRASSKY